MKKLIFTLFYLLVVSNIFAQQIIVFNDSTGSQTKTRTMVSNEDKNIISWNISTLARGALFFEYERKVNDYLTILGGAGITYFNPIGAISSFIRDTYIEPGDITYKAGYAFDLRLKYFPKGMDGWDGFFVAPIYRYRHYAKDWKGNTLNTNSNDFLLAFGGQHELWDGIIITEYFGVGYSNGSEQTIDEIFDVFGIYGIKKSKISRPVFTLGVTIGVPF
jgi:hypothetical protein